MVSRKEISFDKSIPYHIVVRAVEGRKIFAKEEDCYRFIFQMYVANIGEPIHNLKSNMVIKAAKALLNGGEIPKDLIVIEHSPLVYIISKALVLNHYHGIFIPREENAIPKYMQKLHTGFAMYYNLKYNHKGNLFNRPYKIIPIQTNFQSDAVLRYVNIKNPLDVYQPNWREKGLKDEKEALRFLNEYPFSSFPDLFGKRNSKILAPLSIVEQYLGKEITESKEEFFRFIQDYLQKNLIQYNSIFLEES